ncbi:YggS family pyridoxal phosphate-dependent enzyme [Plantibacter sp. YIM 135347]|uniref:YggS family pyridoxal phosphate-dependent enzyme n=1 Tax=Plantibacter sp. YIM 135347 TaxID=3423919 RepID=UPI003D34228E
MGADLESPGPASQDVGPGALASRLAAVREGIADAAAEAGRSADELTLIAVTKFHPIELVRELAALGITDVGENRHPEARDKVEAAHGLGLTWHFIGQLQTNKAKQVRRYVDAVHSIDRPELVRALSSEERTIDGFVQVNLTEDAGRGGTDDAALEDLVTAVLDAPGIHLRGIMAVAPLGAEPRAAFARVRQASERVQRLAPTATAISAGMSHDYREAVLEGATHLRIGTAITGNRPAGG